MSDLALGKISDDENKACYNCHGIEQPFRCCGNFVVGEIGFEGTADESRHRRPSKRPIDKWDEQHIEQRHQGEAKKPFGFSARILTRGRHSYQA